MGRFGCWDSRRVGAGIQVTDNEIGVLFLYVWAGLYITVVSHVVL